MSDRGVLYDLRRKFQVRAIKLTTPEFMSKVYFRIVLKQKLNLKTPKTFNEKIQWLKLNYWPKNALAIRCADKYSVRAYITELGYPELLNDLLGVWDSPDDIDWEALPNCFVLKCNHGCGYNIICRDKAALSKKEVIKTLHKWISEDFGCFNGEIHYDLIPKKIICERFLGEEVVDYKFFCFGGEPRFLYIAQGFGNGNNERITFFNMDGKMAPYQRGDYPIMENAKLPHSFKKMTDLSKVLAKEFPFVRVDWFEVDKKIYFSEFTFTPCGGMMKLSPPEYDEELGKYLDLSGVIWNEA